MTISIEQAEKIIDEMEIRFGTLPNPDHYPKQFVYYLKLFKYIKENDNTLNIKPYKPFDWQLF